MAKATTVSDILDLLGQGDKVLKSDLELVAAAALELKNDFLTDAIRTAETLKLSSDFDGFKKCFASMSDFMLKHGFLTVNEIQAVWMRIEEAHR